MTANKRTLREIIDYPWVSKSNETYMIADCISYLNEVIYGNYLEINYDTILEDFYIERKIDVMYDYRRGAICDVLLFKDEPIAIYMGAGRELEDTEACYILNLEACKNIINAVKFSYEEITHISELDDVVELLFWEGTPVDLGDKGTKS